MYLLPKLMSTVERFCHNVYMISKLFIIYWKISQDLLIKFNEQKHFYMNTSSILKLCNRHSQQPTIQYYFYQSHSCISSFFIQTFLVDLKFIIYYHDLLDVALPANYRKIYTAKILSYVYYKYKILWSKNLQRTVQRLKISHPL